MEISKIDLSGNLKEIPRRQPQYVHDLEAVRGLVQILGRHDYRSMNVLLKQAQFILDSPEERIRKCLKYSTDPKMNGRVVRAALEHLLGYINLSFPHGCDEADTRKIFLHLRNYTFDLRHDKIRNFLNEYEKINGVVINRLVFNRIVRYAKKIGQGITPRKVVKTPYWDKDPIDDWIKKAEKS